ncbi:hypothetical protein [Embleya sp. NBC_00896]|uniref:hypothetical protein n=1 Tax=Embleya sp. NBC_00896 TaxID=2975961 RepID=UPI002F91336C|nr:hypothetical protein OG928_35045 [Embleya sp. NBC_00896]
MSVLTEHVNSSGALAEFPLRADRPLQMGELAPVLATPAAFAAGVAIGVAAYGAGYAVAAVGGGHPHPRDPGGERD